MLDDEVRTALAQSRLANLSEELLRRIDDGAVRVDVPAGGTVHEPEDGPVADLLLGGLLRLYMTSREGRQVNLRYARRGALLGIATLFSPLPLFLVQQAVVPSRVLMMRHTTLRRLAETEASVALALLHETSDRVQEYILIAGGNVFTSVRQRVIAHLLELAQVREGAGPELVAAVGQQQIADATGTVREVVVRVLRDLREEGLVRTSRDGIVLLDPARFESEARPQIL
jgi:CRP/FNR family cyclic AMP-dependent transcriptional regulator